MFPSSISFLAHASYVVKPESMSMQCCQKTKVYLFSCGNLYNIACCLLTFGSLMMCVYVQFNTMNLIGRKNALG